MGRKLRIVGLIVCFAVEAGLLMAEKSKPGSETSKPYLGVDIAVISVGTTGALAESKWAPTVTIKNLGTKPILRDLLMTIKSNGTWITSPQIHVALTPGQTLEWKGQGADRDFAKPGDVVEAFIDADMKLPEDNEANNVMSKTIPFRQRPRPVFPQPSRSTPRTCRRSSFRLKCKRFLRPFITPGMPEQDLHAAGHGGGGLPARRHSRRLQPEAVPQVRLPL